METYIINVLMSFFPYLWIAVGLFLIATFGPKIIKKIFPDYEFPKEFLRGKTALKVLSYVVVCFGLLVSMTFSGNTPKNETHNREQLNQQIQTQNMNHSEDLEISDRTRKPSMTESERSERFSEILNYKNLK